MAALMELELEIEPDLHKSDPEIRTIA